MDILELLGEDGGEQEAAIIEALRQRQAQSEEERGRMRETLGKQQRKAGGLSSLALLASVGQNPLLAGLQRSAEGQGARMDSLAARTEGRMGTADPLAPLRLLQAQQRLKQTAAGLAGTESRFERGQKQSAEQRELDRQSRERAAAIQAGDKATQQQLDNEAKLRGEIAGNKVVQEYQLASVGFDKVRNAANDPSAAGDLALVFGYMKTLDPTSAVKETEFANASNAANVPDRIRNQWNRLKSGERLNPDQRAEFVRSAGNQFAAVKARADAILSGYKGIAEKSGAQADRVIVPGIATPDIDLNAPMAKPALATDKAEAARKWLEKNPNDPKAPAVRERLKQMGAL